MRDKPIQGLVYFFIAAIPFFLFHWTLPFVTQIIPGRDFALYYVWHQMEFLFAIKNGTFPLFYHFAADAGGSSHVWMGYGQAFLPFPYLISLLPGYWTGKAIPWNILAHLLTLPISHVVIFHLIKRFKTDDLQALFLSMVTVYPTGLLLLFRYGNGLSAWIAHLLLCGAVGFYFLNPSRIKGPLTIIGSAYWLINSGHPEVSYFGMLGSLVFILCLPFLAQAILSEHPAHTRKTINFWIKIVAFLSIAILLSAAYLFPLYFDSVKAICFARLTYSDACLLTDKPMGLINNFFSPLRSSSFAAFGGNPLLFTAILIPILKVFRIKIPLVIWGILVVILLACLFMLGNQTPVHFYLWKYLPFASATRIPGRIAIILPLLFSFLLLWLFQAPSINIKKKLQMPVFSFLVLLSLLISLIYFVVIPDSVQSALFGEALFNIRGIPSWVEPLTLVLNAIFLVLIAIGGKCKTDLQKACYLLLCLAGCLQLGLLFKYSPLHTKILHENDIRTYEELVAEKRKAMSVFEGYLYPHDKMARTDLMPQFQNYFLEPHLATIYRDYRNAKDRDDAYGILNGSRKQNEVVVENYPEEKVSLQLAANYKQQPDEVRLVYSSYNRLVFEAQAALSSFFVLSYQKNGYWRAYLNGKRVPSYRANGYAHAVRIPAGKNKIEFRYWSQAAFWGMILSCLTLASLGIFIGLFRLKSHKGLILTAMTILLAAWLFALWYQSLYGGDTLDTHYIWSSPSPAALENIAFGKPTQMSSKALRYPYIHNSRCGVDGGRSFSSCFITDWQPVNNSELLKLVNHPWWEVDLKQPENIGRIVLYASVQGGEIDRLIGFFPDNTEWVMNSGRFCYNKIPVHYNRLPLVIAVSENRINWRFAFIDRMDKHSPLRIMLKEPVTARYLRIIATKPCRLCLDEVEIYRFEN